MKTTFLLVFTLITQLIFSQNLQTSPFIEVIGTAEKEIVPDEIYIGITLREKSEGKNRMSIEEQEKLLFEELKKQAIPLNQLQLSDVSSEELILRKKTNQLISQKEYELKVTSVEEVSRALAAFDSANIKSSYIVEMTHSKLQDYRKEVKILALKAAKDKARYLLESIDQKVGNALEIIEESNTNASSMGSNVYANASYKSTTESNHNISIKPITVKFSIKAKFEIK